MPAPLPIRSHRSPAELRRLARHERDGRVSARLLALANALEGIPREEAARLAGMTGQTLGDWVHRYNAEDITGLCDLPRAGRRCRLDEGQQAVLKTLVLRGPDPKRDGCPPQTGLRPAGDPGCVAWRARDLCRAVERQFQIRYSEGGMLRLLHSLELSWQKPRPIHPEASAKAQAWFKKPAWADAGRRRTPPRGRDDRAVVRG